MSREGKQQFLQENTEQYSFDDAGTQASLSAAHLQGVYINSNV